AAPRRSSARGGRRRPPVPPPTGPAPRRAGPGRPRAGRARRGRATAPAAAACPCQGGRATRVNGRDRPRAASPHARPDTAPTRTVDTPQPVAYAPAGELPPPFPRPRRPGVRAGRLTVAPYRLGIDIGGTFTDFSLLDEATGALAGFKWPTDAADPARGVLDGLRALVAREGLAPGDIRYLVHGTTIAINTVIQRNGARLG